MFEWLKRKAPRSTARTDERELVFDARFQARLDSLAIAAQRIHGGDYRAHRRSKRVGSGIEFADHRDYEPGDDFRRLDWNVYAKTGRLLLRRYEEEADLTVHVLLDTSASMAFGAPSKLRVAKQVSAALCYVALSNLDRVALSLVADGVVQELPPQRGKAHILRIFEQLTHVSAQSATDLEKAIRRVTSQRRRRGVAVVISDFYDDAHLERAFDALTHAKLEAHAVHLVDAQETQLDVRDDLVLIDSETGARREVSLTQDMIDRAEQARKDHVERVRRAATDRQITHHVVDVREPFEDSVLKVLRRGRLLG